MSSPAEPAGSPQHAVDQLAGCDRPLLVGVRHHSPALSVAVPALLDAFDPQLLLLELPAELGRWLPWLADPGTRAPVALAGVVGDDGGPAFYPFADFSPELAAVRWAARRGVPVVACDLPLADPGWDEAGRGVRRDGLGDDDSPGFGAALHAAATGRGDEDMWDRTVEAHAPGADPESVRRAALAVGWALRRDAECGPGVAAVDLRREAWMRRCLAEADGQRAAAVIGAFHAPALLPDAGPAASAGPPRGEVATSLVPYAFPLLDSRSGYPAGIRDPQWQQSMVEAAGDPAAVQAAALGAVVRICARVRADGHPAGPAEAREAVRVATDLARLRGLPAPGRGELVEALQLVLAQGEVLGRGRVVAAAMQEVLVGSRRGVLAAGTPRSGLGPAVRADLAELRLPGPGDPSREVRLDALRSDLDRRREVTLHRLVACRVPYAEQVVVAGVGGLDAVGSRWRLGWGPQTDAMLDICGVRGVTLRQAAEGTLREGWRRERVDGPTAAQVTDGLAAAARCGLVDATAEKLAELAVAVPASGTLPEAIAALALLDRLRLGHVAGLAAGDLAGTDLAGTAEAIEAAAVRQVDGLLGATDPDDARALAALAQRADGSGVGLRLGAALSRLAAEGSPMIAAAAGAVQVLLGQLDPAALGGRAASWLDTATTPDARRAVQEHLTGLLAVAEPLLQAGGDPLDSLLRRVETLPDDRFLSVLPALRGGFHVLSPAARDRLLAVVDERIGERVEAGSAPDPRLLLLRVLADRAGRAALAGWGLAPSTVDDASASVEEDAPATTLAAPVPPASDRSTEDGRLPAADRWRLVLGRDTAALAPSTRRFATALDELYGAGRGEGERADAAGRAGREPPFPDVRRWSEELTALFGPAVREEVVARAVEGGRLDAVAMLDPDAVRPSVELLQTVLSLAGGMPESALGRLRPLVARLVAELTRALATRLRPALSGLSTPRPTYRPGGRLNLPRTVRANLVHSRREPDGSLTLVPQRPVFHTRARRSVDWRLILVVDVSGSMEASVIWSAITASVLAGVPALSTHFVAFSTEVVDLTDRVHDPLGLLLEVQVGGGTHIAAGLRHARSLVTVPSRTLIAVVSDFEEGYPLGGLLGEVRALVESGCTLLGCASLDDTGTPRYCVSTAGQLVTAGMPVAALSPLELARWVAEKVR